MCMNALRRKFIIFLIILLLFIACGYLFFTARFVLIDICSSEINAQINNIINEANDVVLALDVFYDDYFSFIYTKEGKLDAIMANVGLINQITLMWSTEIQNRLNKLRSLNIEIPIGVLTGSALLSQFGNVTNITARVISNCSIVYKSKFIQTGINQTLHRLILFTEINADIAVPQQANNVFVSQEVVLAETIIPGAVPDSYLIGDSACEYLDLLP